MKQFTKYYGVERVTYEFSKREVQEVLMASAKVGDSSDRRIELDLDQEKGATLTVLYEREPPPTEEPPHA